jgi:hypothetical protein
VYDGNTEQITKSQLMSSRQTPSEAGCLAEAPILHWKDQHEPSF